jgi:exodeoxyribonuclease VII small subunit
MPTQTFEQALEKLEQIVTELETGELSLESALKKFETGMRLSTFCSRKLDETEKKITLLLEGEDSETMVEKPFSAHDPETAA